MKEFEINKYLNLKLENEKTNIYVNDIKFQQCKYILIDIPIDASNDYEFESIDEYIDEYKKIEAITKKKLGKLPPEVEFWGHCSNLHYWYLKQYDTNVIHHELAFPLLKALTDAGDPIAKIKFKEEIAKRFGTGYLLVTKYLNAERYLDYLNEEELLLSVKDALENSLKKLDDQAVEWLKLKYGHKLESYFGREEYLHILLTKKDAEIIIELGKSIGKELIIEEYRVNRQLILSFPEEYKEYPPKRTMFTEYSISVENKSVIKLNLSSCGLDFFPEIITNLTNLTNLTLNGNKLKILPKMILKLKNLNYLGLAMCGIKGLQNWFKKLEHLSAINLAGNPLNKKSKELVRNLIDVEINLF
ncbi:hypothetical protein LCGC14_2700080 [marine sediment metagenome]|uniref:Leucine-rich repeat domain-containing protein n=1 Tax=marine sediment metagenome TaxID=412755 RepID=A0A0F8ZG24_9ZZZZ